MNMTNEEFTDAMARIALEPNADIRLTLIKALCGAHAFVKTPEYAKASAPNGKKTTNGGRTKYLSVEEQKARRQKWIGEKVSWDESGAVYEIVGATWNAFEVAYRHGAETNPSIEGLKTAKTMTNAERAITPGVKQFNPRKWHLTDGRTVQKRLEDDELAHPVYVKKSI